MHEKECLTFHFWKITLRPGFASKGDTVIVNLEKVHPRHNDLVLIDLNGQREIAKAERTGALLRLFHQKFIHRDILDDVLNGVILKSKNRYS